LQRLGRADPPGLRGAGNGHLDLPLQIPAPRAGRHGIEARICDICETRVRYGYRRVHVLLRREGSEINMKRTQRIYNELVLQLRNKTPRRRMKAKLKEGRCAASFADLHQKATRIAADFLRHLSAALRYKICTVQCPGARRKSEIWLTSLCAPKSTSSID
jgi:transposase InsO family protein